MCAATLKQASVDARNPVRAQRRTGNQNGSVTVPFRPEACHGTVQHNNTRLPVELAPMHFATHVLCGLERSEPSSLAVHQTQSAGRVQSVLYWSHPAASVQTALQRAYRCGPQCRSWSVVRLAWLTGAGTEAAWHGTLMSRAKEHLTRAKVEREGWPPGPFAGKLLQC